MTNSLSKLPSRAKTTTKARGKKTAANKFDSAKYRKLIAEAMPVVIEWQRGAPKLFKLGIDG